jgi:hypothetical protein
MNEFYTILLFVFIGLIAYLIFRNLNLNNIKVKSNAFGSSAFKEGMNNNTGNNNNNNTTGIAADAAAYAASLKNASTKNLDILLISKYKSDYEASILNLDDLITGLMLKEALKVDVTQEYPSETINNLAQMQQAKLALNSAMKFVDSQ